jgi:hypothetical protein
MYLDALLDSSESQRLPSLSSFRDGVDRSRLPHFEALHALLDGERGNGTDSGYVVIGEVESVCL